MGLFSSNKSKTEVYDQRDQSTAVADNGAVLVKGSENVNITDGGAFAMVNSIARNNSNNQRQAAETFSNNQREISGRNAQAFERVSQTAFDYGIEAAANMTDGQRMAFDFTRKALADDADADRWGNEQLYDLVAGTIGRITDSTRPESQAVGQDLIRFGLPALAVFGLALIYVFNQQK